MSGKTEMKNVAGNKSKPMDEMFSSLKRRTVDFALNQN